MSLLVLVLGKDALTCELVLYNLNKLGFLAVGFEEGSQAYRALAGVKFDAMIMSSSNTDVSANQFLRQVRILQPNLRTILIDRAPPHKAAIQYVDAFVQRPFRMNCVLDALMQVLCLQQKSTSLPTWSGRLQSSAIY